MNYDCCTHYNSKDYDYGYVQLKCFKIAVCRNCGETQLTCNPLLAFIWEVVFSHFWNGEVWIEVDR